MICRKCFLFLLQLSDRTEDLRFCLFSVSNILYKHHSHNNLVTELAGFYKISQRVKEQRSLACKKKKSSLL